jgi:hypothetical protein
LQIKIYLYYNKIISIFVQEFKFRVYILLPFALRIYIFDINLRAKEKKLKKYKNIKYWDLVNIIKLDKGVVFILLKFVFYVSNRVNN